MESFTIRIRHSDGNIEVIQQAWSQLCATIKGASKVDARAFFKGESIEVNGNNIKIIGRM